MSSSHDWLPGSKVIIVASNYVLQQAVNACQSTFNNVYRSTPDQLKKAYNTVCVCVCRCSIWWAFLSSPASVAGTSGKLHWAEWRVCTQWEQQSLLPSPCGWLKGLQRHEQLIRSAIRIPFMKQVAKLQHSTQRVNRSSLNQISFLAALVSISDSLPWISLRILAAVLRCSSNEKREST